MAAYVRDINAQVDGFRCFTTDKDGVTIQVPLGEEMKNLFRTLLTILSGHLSGADNVAAPGVATGLLSGILADAPEDIRDHFFKLLRAYTGITLSVPTKQEECDLEGATLLGSKAQAALRALVGSDYRGDVEVVSVGGGDTKIHHLTATVNETGERVFTWVSSTPLRAKFGTKRPTDEGLAELAAHITAHHGIPRYYMASIGYGLAPNMVVPATDAEGTPGALSTETDENTQNAVAMIRKIATLPGCNIIVARNGAFSGKTLPLNMLAGLASPVKIDAGTATWKVELPDGTTHKPSVNSAALLAETIASYDFSHPGGASA